MNREKQDSPPPRDTTLARLLASALESRTAATSGTPCPDADLLAAYAEHALDADETARWENHFADCARCQQVLAVLTVSAEDPLTQQEIARLGQIVGKAAVPSESAAPTSEISRQAKDSKVARPAKQRAPWRWLVPAFGVTAVAALWFALRPTVPGTAPATQITAEKMAVPPPPGQESQTAQANMPPSPITPSSAGPSSATNAPVPPLTSEKEANSLDREATVPADVQAKQKDEPRDKAGNELPNEVPNEDKKVTPAATAAEADRSVAATPPSAPRSTNQTVTVIGGASAVEKANGAGGATAPAPQSSPSSAGGRLSADNAVKPQPLAARNTMAAMAKTAAAPIVFGTPNQGVEWRVGAGGRIERSTDQGKTWQPQTSGVTSDLVAGAAVSDKIAWIVGRADVILRTTDGEHWLRTTAPPAAPVNGSGGGPVGGSANSRVDAVASSSDWSRVQASDVLHATIVSADGRRYATSDGGRTWTPQP